jgi:multidrug resistance efflux pump
MSRGGAASFATDFFDRFQAAHEAIQEIKVQLERETDPTSIESLKNRLARHNARLESLTKEYETQIKVLEADVQIAGANIEAAQEKLQYAKSLYEKGVASRSSLLEAEREMAVSRAEYEKVRVVLDLYKNIKKEPEKPAPSL